MVLASTHVELLLGCSDWIQCHLDWVCRDVIVRVAAITFGLSAVIWAACQFDFACVPVDVRVVLHKPGVPQDDFLMANA